MKHFCRLESGIVGLSMLSQVQDEIHTDGNPTVPLIKDSVWEKSGGFQGGQPLLACFPPGEVQKHAGSESPWVLINSALLLGSRLDLLKANLAGAGQEFAFLISSQSVSHVHPSF